MKQTLGSLCGNAFVYLGTLAGKSLQRRLSLAACGCKSPRAQRRDSAQAIRSHQRRGSEAAAQEGHGEHLREKAAALWAGALGRGPLCGTTPGGTTDIEVVLEKGQEWSPRKAHTTQPQRRQGPQDPALEGVLKRSLSP